MKKGIAKFTAFVLAAGLTFGEGGTVVMANPATVLAGFGSQSAAAHTETKTEEAAKTEETGEAQESAPAAETVQAETTQSETDQEKADQAKSKQEKKAAAKASKEQEGKDVSEQGSEGLDKSMVGTTGFAQCEEYLNVRSSAGTEGDVVGKVYNNGSLEILDVTPDGWYQVRSGNVEGYVSADFVATGAAAGEIAAATGYTTAEVGAEVLNVRADATTDSDIIATVDNTNVIEVVEDQGDWVKVILDGEMYGYVSADYVYTTTEYATGETLEEEQERLDQEWLAYLAEQEAAQAAAEAAYLASVASAQAQDTTADAGAYVQPDYTDQTAYQESPADTSSAYTPSAIDQTADLSAQCDSAYQNYLDAQAAADAAVANGEGEQAILDTAAQAEAAYATYLQYQNQLDAANAGLSADVQSADTTKDAATAEPAADAYTEPAANDTYTEPAADTYTEPAADTYTEPAQTVDTTPSVSSTGQAIADFACQFVGNPYVYGGSSLTNGADCSGFTMAVMSNFGIGLPHNAAAQSGCGTPVSLDSLQPGDLLFYEGGGGIGHVSIYIGGGQVVHASNPTNGILISSVGYRTPCAARRFV